MFPIVMFRTLDEFVDAAREAVCNRIYYAVYPEHRPYSKTPDKLVDQTFLTLAMSCPLHGDPFPLIGQFMTTELIRSSDKAAAPKDEIMVRAMYETAVDGTIVALRRVGSVSQRLIYPTAIRGLMTWLGDRRAIVGTAESIDVRFKAQALVRRRLEGLDREGLDRVAARLLEAFPDLPVYVLERDDPRRDDALEYYLYVEGIAVHALQVHPDETIQLLNAVKG